MPSAITASSYLLLTLATASPVTAPQYYGSKFSYAYIALRHAVSVSVLHIKSRQQIIELVIELALVYEWQFGGVISIVGQSVMPSQQLFHE